MTSQDQTKVSDVQIELNKLSDSTEAKETACLLNLVIYTCEVKQAQYFEKSIQKITSRVPCRIIFVHVNQDAQEAYLHVNVTAEPIQDSPNVVYDKINIEVSKQEESKVPYLILPYFIPDLPIYLLWGQDPAIENTILPQLLKYAKRLIFDSNYCEDIRLLEKLIPLLETNSIEIVDLNWARIEGWREVLSKVFDSSERIKQLINSETIKIIYNCAKGSRGNRSDTQVAAFTSSGKISVSRERSDVAFCDEGIALAIAEEKNATDNLLAGNRKLIEEVNTATQAIYLQAWLATRLQLEFVNLTKASDKYILTYKNKNFINIELIPKEFPHFISEDIVEFEVFGQDTYNCRISRENTNHVIINSCNQYQCEMPFTLILPNIESARGFIQEVLYQKSSPHYTQMLECVRKMIKS